MNKESKLSVDVAIIVAVHVNKKMKWDRYELYLDYVSKERQLRILKARKDFDRLSLLISELVARKYISEMLCVDLNQIDFRKGTFGKPYLENNDSIFFNWSHSGEWILFIMDKHPVGVDVEKINDIDKLGIANKFFHPYEFQQLEKLEQQEMTQYFFTVWTLKESYLKWKGTGLYTSLDSFGVYKDIQNNWNITELDDTCYLQTINLDSNHCAAICTSKNPEMPIIPKRFSAAEFFMTIKR